MSRKARVYVTKIQLKTYSTFMKSINDMTGFGKNSRGFTMIEIITVLLVLGILSVVVVPRILSTQSISAITERDILITHLRYAQLRALSDTKTWGISFAGSSYSLLRDGNTATYNLPNENSTTHTLPNGITISGSTVTFDEWGSPGTADIQLTMSDGGGTIKVTKNTGFIQ